MSLAPRPARAVFALGSNLGDRAATLQGAVDALADAPGITPVAVSPVYETAPVGGPPQPSYLNAVLVVDTVLAPEVLLDRARATEDAFGRVRGERWGARTLDVDLLVVGDQVRADPDLTLPHPRAQERAFVLLPWCDVAPQDELPGYGRVADLAAAADRAGVRRTEVVLELPA